ncbi:hypothetical protein [Halobellus captivus]|nr:hypothetical protein [Halobellus captivus]
MEHEPDDDPAEPTDEAETDEYSHLDDLADGAGCTEIWEHLSDSREE